MRQITKTVSLPIDGKLHTFRLKKLDALSGVCLLRMLAARSDSGNSGSGSDTGSGSNSNSVAGPDLASLLFSAASDEDLRALLTRCLENVEVLLDAGYQPVMQLGEWSWTDLEYDPLSAFSLAVKEIAWSLDGFFAESGSASPQGQPAS